MDNWKIHRGELILDNLSHWNVASSVGVIMLSLRLDGTAQRPFSLFRRKSESRTLIVDNRGTESPSCHIRRLWLVDSELQAPVS
jgi:hypothetical protein